MSNQGFFPSFSQTKEVWRQSKDRWCPHGYQAPKLFLSLWLSLSLSYYLRIQNGCWSVSHHIRITSSRMEEEGKDNRDPPLAEVVPFKTFPPRPTQYFSLHLTGWTQAHSYTILQWRLEDESFGRIHCCPESNGALLLKKGRLDRGDVP